MSFIHRRGKRGGRPRPTGRIHVLVLGLNYAPETTGIAPYTTALARHLAQQHDVTVVAGHPHYPEWRVHPGYESRRRPEVDHGVRLIRVLHPVPANPSGLSRVWMELAFAWGGAIQLIRQRPDVVVAVSPALLALVPAVLLRRPLGFRVGAVVQDLYGAALRETGLTGSLLAKVASRLEVFLLSHADGIVVIHDVFRRALLSQGVPRNRIEVISNWSHVDVDPRLHRDEARDRLGWPRQALIALHAGNMGVKQGLEGLIDVARLAEAQRRNVLIVLLGNGSRRAHLEEYAKGLKNVFFIDPLAEDEFPTALSAADCLVLHERPGVVEMSVPSKLTTYFAAGRPVVAVTDPRSGAASQMREAQAGVAVPPGDPRRIFEAVDRVASDDAVAAVFAGNARRYASEHFSDFRSLRRKSAWVCSLLDTSPVPSATGISPQRARTREGHETG